MLLLTYPALWESRPVTPATICQVGGPVCLIRAGPDVLIVDGGATPLAVTALHGMTAAVAWNEATLRAAEGIALGRDRQDRRDAQ